MSQSNKKSSLMSLIYTEITDFLLIFVSIVVVWLCVMNYKAVHLAVQDVFHKQVVQEIDRDKEDTVFEVQSVEVWIDEDYDIQASFTKIGRDNDMLSDSLSLQLQRYQYPLNLLPPGRRIMIPSLQVDAPIVTVNYVSEQKMLDGDFDTELRQGVVQYPFTADPGETWNWLLFGHSSISERWADKDNPYGYVFRKLSTLEPGETYSLIRDGKIYDYMIDHKEIVRPEDVADVIEEYDSLGKSTMTAMACYPLFSDAQRILVRAVLMNDEDQPASYLAQHDKKSSS